MQALKRHTRTDHCGTVCQTNETATRFFCVENEKTNKARFEDKTDKKKEKEGEQKERGR